MLSFLLFILAKMKHFVFSTTYILAIDKLTIVWYHILTRKTEV